MKLVQYSLAAIMLAILSACGTDSSSATSAKCDADSTFAQVQQQIFDGQGCTASACHGEAANAGLDLRAENAYANLINVDATSGDYVRVFPGAQDLSVLYQKVAAKTEGFQLSSLPNPISGGAMPTGNGVLSDDDLGLLRAWIRGGAPEAGIVAGSEQYASCELEGDLAPNKIQPLPAPETDEGVQFYSGGWTVPAEGEGEVCFISYYDYSDQIPAEFTVPCGEAQGGPEQDCFVYDEVLLAQDPQSHHSIIEFYVPPHVCVGGEKDGEDCDQDESVCGDGAVCALNPDHLDPTNDVVWKDWQCLGGDLAGTPCTPGSDECGSRGQCATEPLTTVACINYPNAPRDVGNILGFFGRAAARQNLATAQESSFREAFPPNVFAMVPVKGFVIWDSHAFNLTKADTTVEQWMNLTFAPPEELLYPRTQIFDADDIFGMGRIEAFSSGEACASFEIPQYGRLMTLSTHTHRFGKDFGVWYPPNEVCDDEGNPTQPTERPCERPTRDADYVSFDYADPLYQRFNGDDVLRFDSPNAEDRTFVYCSVWDNGESNPSEVRRESTKPDAETCDFVDDFALVANLAGIGLNTCGCEPEDRSCFGGPNEGMPCNGDGSVCGAGGVCDACPVGGGVTTEEEMFILLGSYFVETP
ncbi:MAG: hypothetical protein WBM75_18900 [Polyangiales bacterium]